MLQLLLILLLVQWKWSSCHNLSMIVIDNVIYCRSSFLIVIGVIIIVGPNGMIIVLKSRWNIGVGHGTGRTCLETFSAILTIYRVLKYTTTTTTWGYFMYTMLRKGGGVACFARQLTERGSNWTWIECIQLHIMIMRQMFMNRCCRGRERGVASIIFPRTWLWLALLRKVVLKELILILSYFFFSSQFIDAPNFFSLGRKVGPFFIVTSVTGACSLLGWLGDKMTYEYCFFAEY